MSIVPLTGSGLTEQLADHLRQRIRNGEFVPKKPGEDPRLPSLLELEEQYGVSSTTVRAARGMLEDQGLVWSATGRGVFVRKPMHQRIVSSRRYRHHDRAGFVERHGITADEFTMDPCRFTTHPAGTDVGDLLAIAPTDQVLERYQVLRARGMAEEIRWGYFPLWLVAGTRFMDPSRQPYPGGLMAELTEDELGVRFRWQDGLVEKIAAQRASTEESETLRISPGWGVLVSNRVAYDDQDRPVAAEKIVYPADRTVIEVHIDLGNPL